MVSKDGINEVQSCPGPHFHKRTKNTADTGNTRRKRKKRSSERQGRQTILKETDTKSGRREQKVLRLYDYKIRQPYFGASARKYRLFFIHQNMFVVSTSFTLDVLFVFVADLLRLAALST